MFDKFLIVPDSLRNVINHDGAVEGFELKIRIPYYRGVPLSCVEDITINVYAGVGATKKTFTSEQIRFTVASGSFTMKEMETVATKRWNFDAAATLLVSAPGGLVYFDKDVELIISIRAPYGTFSSKDKKHMVLGADKVLA